MSAQTPGFISMPQGGAQRGHSPHSMPGRNNKPASAPGTPNLNVNTSSIPPVSPSLQRRSSTQSQRPGSSASPRLNRSRSSLGTSSPGPYDDVHKRPTPKRSISNLITELRGAQATMEVIPEPVVLTAPQIARDCFEKELAGHEEAAAETIVLLHDACYGHRFSRLKSTKSSLSMIVERPERLLASVLGVATTYVRLGGYYEGQRHAPRPRHTASSPPPFKIRRTARTIDIKSNYVTNVHGTEWMAELGTMCGLAGQKLAACEKEVARQGSSFGEDKRSLHEGDLYLCEQSRDAFEGALGGVADAVDAVFSDTPTRRAFVAVRPPGHHCSADYPSGFCWINNVHVGIEYAAQTYDLTHAAIIDFDLHHGDGSQAITWERNSKNSLKRLYPKSYAKSRLAPDIGYYSIHDINSYPCEMGDDEKVQAASLCIHQAHGQSIWNVHLQTWKTIDEFWNLYESRYMILLDKARDFLQQHTSRVLQEGKQKPKAAIFISAGFDASEWEGEGMQRHKVNVPTDFYARFTEDILKVAREVNTGCDGRVISVLEGGYSDRALCSSTISHLSALCAIDVVPERPTGGLGSSMLHEQMSELTIAQPGYQASWWSAANLAALEHHVNPPPPSAAGKKMRAGPHPTYATPTESFAYKVIDPAKFARSVSGTMREGAAPLRPVTPPPPEVDWIVAAHELSKLLIPIARSTTSHTAESLAGSKVKKERPGSAELGPSPDDPSKPRQLRTRGNKPIAATPVAASKRAVSMSDRRKTMTDLPRLPAEPEPIAVQARRPSRRSSMASTTSTVSALPDMEAPPVPALPAQRPGPASMQVKKTRVPATPGAKAKKIVAPTPGKSSVAMTPAAVRSGTPDTPGPDPGVDALASGMKRITLKVGSREESERRAKEKLDADRRARALKAAETRRINKAAKDAKAAQERLITNSLPTSSEPSSAVDDSSIIVSPSKPPQTLVYAPEPTQMALPQDQLVYDQAYHAPSHVNGIQEHAPPELAPPAIHAQPLTPQRPSGMPVFSSTGHIPFAATTQHMQHGQASYIQPGAPATPYQYGQQQTPSQPESATLHYEQPQLPAMNAYDVWAVPDTPAKQMYDPQR